MALSGYLTLEAQTNGAIEGSVNRTGLEGTIEVYGWGHEIDAPRDAATGLPTGKRQHRPLTITKRLDQATPLLAAALVKNDLLTVFELRLFQPTASGQEENFFTISLENATISNIRMEQLNNKYPENMQHAAREHVSFTYEKIYWDHINPAISAEDDWETVNR